MLLDLTYYISKIALNPMDFNKLQFNKYKIIILINQIISRGAPQVVANKSRVADGPSGEAS